MTETEIKSPIVEVVLIFKGYQLDKDGNRTQKTHTVEASDEIEAELLLEDFFVNLNKEKSDGRKPTPANTRAKGKTNPNSNK